MRTWKAVVLLNLALLVGAGWGYAFWGLRAARLERELAAAPAGAAGGGGRAGGVGGGGRGGVPVEPEEKRLTRV